jgi:tetratricopeptide (TPR) repeat protein
MFRLLIFILVTLPTLLLAQSKDEQLAAQYFNNAEYDKAADIYEKLNAKNPESSYIYDNLLVSYFQLKQWEDAAKLVKKQQRKFPINSFYKVDEGYVLEKSGSNEKAIKYFSQLINQSDAEESKVIQLASAFQKRSYIDYAITCYQRGRKINGAMSLKYSMELAQLYDQNGAQQLMMDEYINTLQINPHLQEEIQGYLQGKIVDAKSYEYLKTALIKRLKTYPDYEVFQAMLIWLYVQKRDFNNAFLQAKSLDKRYKEQGVRISELGILALQNESYDAAIQIFTYVISLGSDKPMYLNAQTYLLDARRQKIVNTQNYTQQDLIILEQAYLSFLNENGKSHFTIQSMRELAALYVYYLNRIEAGIILYNEILAMQRADAFFRSRCKLELGDIYVLKGDVWEAMLLYGQVDKDYKEDPLGQEAKYRNARLSYFLGEFEWAQAQLDVLKTATTQLISNNALELSLLIQDNSLDSNTEPLKYFAQADLNFYQRKNDIALRYLDTINSLYPRHELDDDILFKRGEIYISNKQYSEAITNFELTLKEHGSGIWGDNALFMIAQLQEKYLGLPDKAKESYTRLLTEYPGSFFCTEARRRIRFLRGEQIN